MQGNLELADLLGTWKLASMRRTLAATGEVYDPSPDRPPSGWIKYGDDGRMLVINVLGGRPKPASIETITDDERAQLFRTMTAYSGTFTFDGSLVHHHIDVSWNECWTGTTQVRRVTRDGDRIVLTTLTATPGPDNKMGTISLVWEKA